MIALRILGIVFGVVLLLIVSRRYAERRSRRIDFLVGLAVSLAIILIGAYPPFIGPLLNVLDFRKGDNRQLIGLLVLSNFLLFLLYLRASGLATAASRDISRLVRALSQREFRREAGTDTKGAEIIVVIPAYDEEATVGQVLEQLPKEAFGLRVEPLVVVDGAHDDTEGIVRRYATPVAHAINRGQGAALLTGYQLATERGARIIVVTDADAQTAPDELAILVEPIIKGEADFVNGSRWLGTYQPDSRLRAAGVIASSLVVTLLTHNRITDVASPFRAFKASEVPRLNLYEDQFQASELIIEALRKGLRVKEVPITMRRRNDGKSKKPGLPRYGMGVAKAIIQSWLR